MSAQDSIGERIAADREHYEQGHDEAEWGEPVPAPTKPSRRLDTMVSVRLSPQEAAEVRAAAAAERVSLSGFMRRAALDRAAAANTTTATYVSPHAWRYTTTTAPGTVLTGDSGNSVGDLPGQLLLETA